MQQGVAADQCLGIAGPEAGVVLPVHHLEAQAAMARIAQVVLVEKATNGLALFLHVTGGGEEDVEGANILRLDFHGRGSAWLVRPAPKF